LKENYKMNRRSASAKGNAPDEKNNSSSITSTISKAFTAEAVWADKDEFLDVIYWIRQILGIILGVLWGVFPLKGIFGFVLFFLVNIAIVYIYYNSFQKIDEEEYGGATEIIKEGLMTSFSSFLVCWIIFYSSLYTDL